MTYQVSCRYAQAALPAVDKEIARAKETQSRLAACSKEMDNIQETIRLGEVGAYSIGHITI